MELNGYFDDDGNEINMDLIKKPGLCLICKKDNDPQEEVPCNLNRLDQRNETEFLFITDCCANKRMFIKF